MWSQGPNYIPPLVKSNRLLLLSVPFTALNHLLPNFVMNHTENAEEKVKMTEKSSKE